VSDSNDCILKLTMWDHVRRLCWPKPKRREILFSWKSNTQMAE